MEAEIKRTNEDPLLTSLRGIEDTAKITDLPKKDVSERPRRAPHTKKRSGCLTCKARRVRCDEKLPLCSNCERTGRVCQGYVFPTPLTRTRKRCGFRAFRYNFQPYPLQQTASRATTAQESRTFEYFVSRTIPSLKGRFQPEKWTDTLLCLQELHPALRYCCLALGSLHAATARHEAKQEYSFSRHRHELANTSLLAMRYYTRSLELLRIGIGINEFSSTSLRLACILLMVYESLHGRRQEMTLHLRMGLSLVECPTLESSTDAEIERIFSRLGFSHALYGRPRVLSSPEVRSLKAAYSLSHKTEFTSFAHARWNTHQIMRSIFSYAHACDMSAFEDMFEAREAKTSLQNTLSRWSWNLEHHATQDFDNSTTVETGYILLRAHCEMGFVFLHAYSAHESTPIRYDACLPRFQKIVEYLEDVIARTFVNAKSSDLIFSVDLSIIPLLFYTALKCRHPDIRRRAVDLLSKVPRYEVAWDASTAAKAAEAVIEFEEQYLLRAQDGVSFSIPEECRIHSVDIQEPEDPENLRRVAILRWKPNGPATPYERKRIIL